MSDLIVLRNAGGDEAVLTLHGGQLLSWNVAGAGEQVYCSPGAVPGPGKALRGGAPICFPQFANRGPLPKHGLARTRAWSLVAPPLPGAEIAEAQCALDVGASQDWPHAFGLLLAVRLGPRWLELRLRATNAGASAFEFTGAIHTYLAMADVRQARLHGLQGLSYEDALDGLSLKREEAEVLAFPGPLDRVYRQVPRALRLEGGGMPERRLLQEGFADTVVWNPGPVTAAALGDMPAEDWTRMLCIEAAAASHPVLLAPGASWEGAQRLELPGLAGFRA